MTESLNGILQSIQNHIKSENANSVKNKAIGRGKVQIGRGVKHIWITNREIESSSNLYYDRNYVVHGDTKVKDECLIYIINELPDLINDKGLTATDKIKLTLPPTNTLTAEQVAVATSKGWTCVNCNF